MTNSIFDAAWQCLITTDAMQKVKLTHQLVTRFSEGALLLNDDKLIMPIQKPGYPTTLKLVPPRDLKKRKLGSLQGRAALIHAIAHIEFNAIHIAWDAIYRFRGMPNEYYADWAKVAYEEATHFNLLNDYLVMLGYQYGDLPAHNGLWDMCEDTAHCVLSRMALVPRVLEARGLDVTPGMMDKLQQVGDEKAVEILKIIFRDEIGHVLIGNRWYRYCCEQQQVDPITTFQSLIKTHLKSGIKPPINVDARKQSGFFEEELAFLVGLTEEQE